MKGRAARDTLAAMLEGLREFLIAASRGGGRNFRPIAPVTAEGRRVVPGRVYRSGHLGEMPDDVRRQVRELGLRTVVTFQTRQEIEILGDPLPEVLPDVEWRHIPIGDRWFEKSGALPHDLASQGAFYLSMVEDHPEEWTRFFRIFAARERYPVLYHCTAGRDRTGVATVLLLEALGVPRTEIVADYLVSNAVFPESFQEAHVLDPLFAAIDAAGGIERFARRLGLRTDELDTVRANLIDTLA